MRIGYTDYTADVMFLLYIDYHVLCDTIIPFFFFPSWSKVGCFGGDFPTGIINFIGSSAILVPNKRLI